MALARYLGLSGLAASSLMILWIVLSPAAPLHTVPDPAVTGTTARIRP